MICGAVAAAILMNHIVETGSTTGNSPVKAIGVFELFFCTVKPEPGSVGSPKISI